MIAHDQISVLIPACNEESSIHLLIETIRGLGSWQEVLVVDDGSSDKTAKVALAAGATVIRHPYNKGNGAAVKTAIRRARGEFVLLLDADGQHAPEDIQKLVEKLPDYDLVVGARAFNAQATISRGIGNSVLSRFASFLSGFSIPDLTSGFRAAHRDRFREFLHLLPNGFSYPTTTTLAFIKAGYNVCFVPIDGQQRKAASTSKMRPWKEGSRFVMIILRMITLFSPLRVFLPAAICCLFLGVGYAIYTSITEVHITNTSVTLIFVSLLLFFFGLLSEQISSLRFEHAAREAKQWRKEVKEPHELMHS